MFQIQRLPRLLFQLLSVKNRLGRDDLGSLKACLCCYLSCSQILSISCVFLSDYNDFLCSTSIFQRNHKIEKNISLI